MWAAFAHAAAAHAPASGDIDASTIGAANVGLRQQQGAEETGMTPSRNVDGV